MEIKKRIDKEDRYNLPELVIFKDDIIFKIMMGGNGDLYWVFLGDETDNKEIRMEITKLDNRYLYEAIDELYERIANCKIFSDEAKDLNKDYKIYYDYDELYKDGIVHWKSDDRDQRYIGNVFIAKKGDTYIISYKEEENVDGYNEWALSSIRFRTSGSAYGNAFLPFLEMYNRLSKVPDLNKGKDEKSIDVTKLSKTNFKISDGIVDIIFGYENLHGAYMLASLKDGIDDDLNLSLSISKEDEAIYDIFNRMFMDIKKLNLDFECFENEDDSKFKWITPQDKFLSSLEVSKKDDVIKFNFSKLSEEEAKSSDMVWGVNVIFDTETYKSSYLSNIVFEAFSSLAKLYIDAPSELEKFNGYVKTNIQKR